MGEESKFQQQWKIRKRENDSESFSADSDSHSSMEPAFKKRRLAAGLVSCEDDETNHSPNPDKPTKAQQRKRSKDVKLTFSRYEPVLALNGLKIFMESLLSDLKASRDKLLERLKDEMCASKIGDTKSTKTCKGAKLGSSFGHQQHYTNFGRFFEAQICNGHNDLHRAARSATQTGMVKEEKPGLSSNPFQSSIRFATPTENDIVKMLGRPNTSPNRRQEERFRKFPQNSITGNGFSVPSQVRSDTHSRDIFGLRMSGEIIPGWYFPFHAPSFPEQFHRNG